MGCLKCGRETDQTFCESCRETMKKYPVKPGAVVILPRERKTPAKQQPVRLPRWNGKLPSRAATCAGWPWPS